MKKMKKTQNLENIREKPVESVPKRSTVPVQTVSPLRVPQYLKSPGSQECLLEEQRRHKSALRTPEKKHSKHLDPSCERARELKKKLDFMACIDLVPPDSIRDTPGKRSERKRKSTNNPNFAYGFELERRPKLTNFLASDYFGAKKTKPKPPISKSENTSPSASRPTTPVSPNARPVNNNHQNTKENMPENTVCHICHLGGQLIQCDSCRNIYHLKCLIPPLTIVPTGTWSCHKCQESSQKCSTISLSAVNNYISNKTGKEEDKRKLLKRSAELLQEKTHLENRSKQLNEILARQGVRKQELIEINLKAKQSVENLKNFVKAVQSS
ncbi:PHD finger protein 21A-like [Ruditapes philippinarum]|uniref:PHD finger protein 21A-like n=1 Tax=Ruditapes philippinarum TaxID=129788 RepID=UPI00295AE30C|nr:PHD finger protein 21A-like [Ruditapes philippinarum]